MSVVDLVIESPSTSQKRKTNGQNRLSIMEGGKVKKVGLHLINNKYLAALKLLQPTTRKRIKTLKCDIFKGCSQEAQEALLLTLRNKGESFVYCLNSHTSNAYFKFSN